MTRIALPQMTTNAHTKNWLLFKVCVRSEPALAPRGKPKGCILHTHYKCNRTPLGNLTMGLMDMFSALRRHPCQVRMVDHPLRIMCKKIV